MVDRLGTPDAVGVTFCSEGVYTSHEKRCDAVASVARQDLTLLGRLVDSSVVEAKVSGGPSVDSATREVPGTSGLWRSRS